MFGVAAIVSCLYLVVLAMVGAFESHHVLSLGERLAYNLLIIGLSLFVGYAAFVFTICLTRNRSELQTVLALALMLGLVVNLPSRSQSPPYPDTHFIGRRAIEEFNAAGGESYNRRQGASRKRLSDKSLAGVGIRLRTDVLREML